MIFALLFVEITLPFFNTITNNKLTLNIFSDYQTLFGILIITLSAGLIAGSYPALSVESQTDSWSIPVLVACLRKCRAGADRVLGFREKVKPFAIVTMAVTPVSRVTRLPLLELAAVPSS
jgi:hypothetical protein